MLVETDIKSFIDLLTQFNSLLSQFQKQTQLFSEQNGQPLEQKVSTFSNIKLLKTNLDGISKQLQNLQKSMSSYFENKNVTQYSNKFYSDSESDSEDDITINTSTIDANAKRQYERLIHQYKNLTQSYSILSKEYSKIEKLMQPHMKKDPVKDLSELVGSNNNSIQYTSTQTFDISNPYVRIQSQIQDDKFVPVGKSLPNISNC